MSKISLMAALTLAIICIAGIITWRYVSKDKQILVDGTVRKYRLHLPANYDPKKSYPLLISLHGYGDDPRLNELYTGFSSLADYKNFIVVYPYGSNDETDGKKSWNAGFCCGVALRRRIDDKTFLLKLIDILKTEYSVDGEKVFITGFSNGAMMAQAMASEYPELFAGLAAVAGSIDGELTDYATVYRNAAPQKPLKVMLIHGRLDATVPIEGATNPLKNMFASFAETVNFWVKNNEASLAEEKNFEHGTKRLYTSNRHTAVVISYELDNVTHTWPGGAQEKLSKPFAKKFDASREIWNFFEQQ